MLAQRLRHRGDIQAPTVTQDPATGAVATSWATVRTGAEPLIAAEIVPLSGREFLSAQAIQAGVTTRITVRWRPVPVRPAMRFVHQGDVYDIKAVLPDPKLRGYLTLMCEQGVNNG